MIPENEFRMDPNENTEPKQNDESSVNIDQNQENEKDMEDSDFVDDGNETDDEYGSSGEKYGWYNGFSDDAIDDAFEGDPENTWNVD
jgi:hypothetical protein